MHLELHVGFVDMLSVHNERFVITVIGYLILLDQVLECDDIGDGIFAEPNVFVVSRDRCFVGDPHSTTIALQCHCFL